MEHPINDNSSIYWRRVYDAFKIDNVEITINDKENEVIEEHLQSLFPRYHIRLETSVKSSDFLFDCGSLFYYKCPKINFQLGGS